MQRCSQCDFIYEDDQHLCDMDGQELVYEPTLQSLQIGAAKVATTACTPPQTSGARRQALAAGVALLIAIVLSLGYFGFTTEYAPQHTKAPATNVNPEPQPAPDQSPATPAVSPMPSPGDSPESDTTTVSGNEAAPLAQATPGYGSATSSGETMRSQPKKANHKKETGIRGLLKKTGKILKKPFKF
jgi:hypothetical protein